MFVVLVCSWVIKLNTCHLINGLVNGWRGSPGGLNNFSSLRGVLRRKKTKEGNWTLLLQPKKKNHQTTFKCANLDCITQHRIVLSSFHYEVFALRWNGHKIVLNLIKIQSLIPTNIKHYSFIKEINGIHVP